MVPSVLLADNNPINTDILEIKTLGKKWLELYRSSNIEKFMDLYTEDALVALNGKPALKGKEAIQAYFASRIGKKNVDMRLDYEKISIYQPRRRQSIKRGGQQRAKPLGLCKN